MQEERESKTGEGLIMGKTLAEKLWTDHLVRSVIGEPDLIYIDLHLIHEVTSAQAFDGLRLSDRVVRRPDLTIATEDHNTPTLDIDKPIADPVSRLQVDTLRANCKEFGVRLHSLGDAEQGIVHVVGPQLGLTQPGMTIVCGDSHTSTHGAFGSLAFGIGTSEVEHVLATQTLPLIRPKTMAININGTLPDGVSAKDIILTIIAKIGTGGGQGFIIEYRGTTIESLSMEGRMTICNMSIEAGARAGLIAPDQRTFDYLQSKPHAPNGEEWDQARAYWETLVSDSDAQFDEEVFINAQDLAPFVTWGTNPAQGAPLNSSVPVPEDISDAEERSAAQRALIYMGLEAGMPLKSIKIDTVFLGSCTNGRIEDLRSAAEILRDRRISSELRMLVVPGSARVKLQAESEGLDQIFIAAGAEWRSAGCSMCLGMNPDQLTVGERSASTSNRNFEGRQGKGGRTHLVSPVVAAATAIRGTLSSPADLQGFEREEK
jgi:3-isopropylmalate/(R)-2-methylmalate dehydratase large subunit